MSNGRGDEQALPAGVQVQSDVITIDSLKYYDIMFLGLTGQGKTTTSEKILIANPTRINYGAKYPKPSDQTPKTDSSKQQVVIQDLSMWLIPEDPFALERINTRMKNLAYYRVLNDPHKHVNDSHLSEMHVNERTVKCELFSNETTKLRVLDVPGFFGAVQGADRSSHDITLNAKNSHLGTMRNILQIQAAMAMKFRRILYFLPCRDTLQISHAPLQQELQLMTYYFGRSVFEVMVLVATLGPFFYKMVPESSPLEVPEEELEQSREVFRETLESFFPDDTPNPPIIFVSMRDNCESILQKVQEAEVARGNGLQLNLSSTVCARCSMTIGERNGMRVACTADGKWSQSILYENSHCHPFFVPKYTTAQKITEGIKCAVKTVVKRERQQWPDFSEEKCHDCQGRPGSDGCLLVGTPYEVDGESYDVNHTSKVEEYHKMLLQEDPVRDETHSGTVSTTSQRSSSNSENGDSSGYEGGDSGRGVFSDGSIVVAKPSVTVDVEPEQSHRVSVCSLLDRKNYEEVLSDHSEGFTHKEVVRVDIEPVESGSGSHSAPEIESYHSDKPERN